jgi:hypothetical protein
MANPGFWWYANGSRQSHSSSALISDHFLKNRSFCQWCTLASSFENFRSDHPSGRSNGTRSANRKAVTTFRGIVAGCHASHIRITSALVARTLLSRNDSWRTTWKARIWAHGAPMGQSSRRRGQSASRSIGIINGKSLKNWSPPDRDSEKLWALFPKSLGKALKLLATRNKIQYSRSDNRLPRVFWIASGFFFQFYKHGPANKADKIAEIYYFELLLQAKI